MQKPHRYVRLLAASAASAAIMFMPVTAAASASDIQAAASNMVSTGLPGAWGVDSSGTTGAAGVANVMTYDPTTPGMKDRIGSVTKAFVGEVALQLVAENQLNLNDTVQHWVPGLLPYGNDVTVKQL